MPLIVWVLPFATASRGLIFRAHYTPHHLITVATAENYSVLRDAAAAGYNINRANNGVPLPRTIELSIKHKLPLHTKRHIQSYFDEVNRRLRDLQQRYDAAAAAGKPWSQERLLKEVTAVEDGLRSALLDPKNPLRLQYNDPIKPPLE